MMNAKDNNQSPGSDDRLIEPAKRQASDNGNGSPSPPGEPTATVQPEAAASDGIPVIYHQALRH